MTRRSSRRVALLVVGTAVACLACEGKPSAGSPADGAIIDGAGGQDPTSDSGSAESGGAPPPGGGLDGLAPPAEGGTVPPLEVLKRPPFAPRDLSFFSRSFFPTAPADPGPGTPLDEAQARALLMQTLASRPTLTGAQVSATVALFDDPRLKQAITAPVLRAALLLTRGTAGDAAIEAVTAGAFAQISFGMAPAFFGDTPAWVEAVGARAVIKVATWAEGEDPRVLASVLAHETLHSDGDVQSKEEAICAAIEAIIHGQLVLETPGIATGRSRLARHANTRLLERLNSRDGTGKLRLVSSSGYTLPGSQVGYGSFVEYYEPFFARPTAGNPTLSSMVVAVTGQRPAAGFDNALVELLDAQQVALSPEHLVRLAEILQLDTNPAPPVPAPARPPSSLPPPTPATATPAEMQAQQILRQPPFTPRTPALLDPGLYAGSPPGDFASPPGLDAAGARALLQETLSRRFGGADARTAATLAAFDGAALAAAVPDPALRAGLLSLRGTAGDTVIEALAAGVFAGLVFTEAVADLPRATVLPPTPQARPRLAINGLLRFEDPRLIAPWIVEAALHEDAVETPKENLVGQALLPLIYGQLLLETPALARKGTLLARQLNGLLFGRLNSRDVEGRLRLTASRGNIFPGSVTNVGSYLGVFIPFGPDTPGGRTLWDVVTAVTGEAAFEGQFSIATIRLLEERQTLWSAEQMVTLLRTLEANVP